MFHPICVISEKELHTFILDLELMDKGIVLHQLNTIHEEFVEVLKTSFTLRLQTLLLNEYEKLILEEKNLFSYDDFISMQKRSLDLEDTESEFYKYAIEHAKNIGINPNDSEYIFLNKNKFQLFTHELKEFLVWRAQTETSSSYCPTSRPKYLTDSQLRSIPLAKYAITQINCDQFSELRSRYHLSSLLSLFTIEDYFVDLYISTYLLIKSNWSDVGSLLHQINSLMRLLPFNRIKRNASNFELHTSDPFYTENLDTVIKLSIPYNLDSSIIDIFHQLSVQLTTQFLNNAVTKNSTLNSKDPRKLKELSNLLEQINHLTKLTQTVAKLYKQEDSPYLLNQKSSLLTGLFVLLYKFYEKRHPKPSTAEFLEYVSTLFKKRGYETKIFRDGPIDHHQVRVTVPLTKGGKSTKIYIKLIYGTILTKKKTLPDEIIRFNKLAYLSI